MASVSTLFEALPFPLTWLLAAAAVAVDFRVSTR
jgi:hypothetical protein